MNFLFQVQVRDLDPSMSPCNHYGLQTTRPVKYLNWVSDKRMMFVMASPCMDDFTKLDIINMIPSLQEMGV